MYFYLMKPVKDLLILVIISCFFFTCKKEEFTTDPGALLQTSVDALHFDTVFTSTGSFTQVVKIINNNNKGIHINSVKLGGGAQSSFKINVDGTSGAEVNNVDVLAEDSIYVFVTVHIDPTSANLPFLVRDSISIQYNGVQQWIQLEAYGQNAHFFRNRIVTGSETWNNDLPYVILEKLTVDVNSTLIINKGCRIFIHADAPFIVHGTLQVNGEKWDSTRVVFTGDRLDELYRDFPASYPGIIFSDASMNSVLNYAIIKNAYQGIVVMEPSAGTKLTLNETIIDNAYDAGLIAVNSSISARNLLVSNCGTNIQLINGGNYIFNHCTVASVSNNFILHRQPVLIISDFLNAGGSSNLLNAQFQNCIFWGEENGFVEDEVVVLRSGNTPFNVQFEQVLWRIENTPSHSIISGSLIQDPLFDTINTGEQIYSFRLKENSPAINMGMASPVTSDLDGNNRPVGIPDLGAYEKQ